MSRIAMVRDFDRCLEVNVVLEAESFAEISAASTAVSEPIHIAI